MSDSILRSLDITNFRSIRGHIHAPLDAKVVLVHGENGAGKTSLLSAIELALTGQVQSLLRADPNYDRQLLHRSTAEGSVVLRAVNAAEQTFSATLDPAGAKSGRALAEPLASFFKERAFLPQSLLGQLLQIYQDAGNDAGSPLAQFVGKLLGLDRLDALEAGLKPLMDVRNVRKTVDGWLAAENEKSRLDRLLTDQRRSREAINDQIVAALSELANACGTLDVAVEVREDNLETVAAALSDDRDEQRFAVLADQQRQFASIRREIDQAQSAASSDLPTPSGGASEQFSRWEATNGARVAAARARVEALLPDLALPSDPFKFADEALTRLRTERKQLDEQATQARAAIVRRTAAQDERDVAQRQRETIDSEVELLPATSGSLASALAELTSFIDGNVCPVCDRDFAEVSQEPLSDHVHVKIRTLSASAERLLTLGRTKAEVQVTLERLDRELEALSARVLDEEALADLDRRHAGIDALVAELDAMSEVLREGARLRAADVAVRRAVSEAQSRHVSLAAARETLTSFATSAGEAGVAEGESFDAAVARISERLAAQTAHLQLRVGQRREGLNKIAVIRLDIKKRQDADAQISTDFSAWQEAHASLERAQALRDQGIAVRNAVDRVRSAIIRREFNDRLNRLWRDLFVRLAPGEPFVPAFRIPSSSTQKLQPKLITEHRDGGEAGGAPGAMLSAGNLNTAALTLFIALHLSVPKELPWLILDDPVQSMDDVHIAHFAALLRTLSKEHGRQVMIAVHDRQLFEYLRLELSPAFPDDSLLTLELSRGARRDSVCVSKRYSYKEETALLAAA
ncbi:AAA family ATPase [Bradyrhizobium sp. CCGB01]|uniref:AAA family ATPase n=1 Tax=Bradyrhizobium sp. CCGB01 TaxID=2949634 RepID=UPI0020B1BD4F|nr:AAA family ATPase [Bradyrhizobium sp. CCGB01]MCP3404804.1 AAA family ATPase [Bradyrhizobium sp. CCGB01]